jgi:hypothetical protein
VARSAAPREDAGNSSGARSKCLEKLVAQMTVVSTVADVFQTQGEIDV